MESSVEANHVGLDNDAFENSGELSPSPLRFDLKCFFILRFSLQSYKIGINHIGLENHVFENSGELSPMRLA